MLLLECKHILSLSLYIGKYINLVSLCVYCVDSSWNQAWLLSLIKFSCFPASVSFLLSNTPFTNPWMWIRSELFGWKMSLWTEQEDSNLCHLEVAIIRMIAASRARSWGLWMQFQNNADFLNCGQQSLNRKVLGFSLPLKNFVYEWALVKIVHIIVTVQNFYWIVHIRKCG